MWISDLLLPLVVKVIARDQVSTRLFIETYIDLLIEVEKFLDEGDELSMVMGLVVEMYEAFMAVANDSVTQKDFVARLIGLSMVYVKIAADKELIWVSDFVNIFRTDATCHSTLKKCRQLIANK